jgi:hypothetical protein
VIMKIIISLIVITITVVITTIIIIKYLLFCIDLNYRVLSFDIMILSFYINYFFKK